MFTFQAQLRDLIAKYFNDEELRNLCFDLDIPYDDLGSEGKTGKVRELVAYCQRHNRLDDLAEQCHALRPNVNWPGSEPRHHSSN